VIPGLAFGSGLLCVATIKIQPNRLAEGTEWRIFGFMADPRPIFLPGKIKTGAGWRVRATWPNGEFENIGAFRSEEEAIRWIAKQSEVWLGSPLAANRPPRKRPRDEPTPEEHQAAELGRRGSAARAKALSGKKRKAAKAARARPAAARARRDRARRRDRNG